VSGERKGNRKALSRIESRVSGGGGGAANWRTGRGAMLGRLYKRLRNLLTRLPVPSMSQKEATLSWVLRILGRSPEGGFRLIKRESKVVHIRGGGERLR